MPTLEFNSVELLQVSYRASERAVADFNSRPRALTLDSLVAAVFAAAAVEAFTNDLADHVEVWRTAGDWAFNSTTPELIRAAQEMIAIDAARQRDQLAGKVRAAGRALAGGPKKADGRDLQDLHRLITVRDAIMHAHAPRPAPRLGLPEVMADLSRSDLTVPHEGANANVFSSWSRHASRYGPTAPAGESFSGCSISYRRMSRRSGHCATSCAIQSGFRPTVAVASE